jgi:hypothetical protein
MSGHVNPTGHPRLHLNKLFGIVDPLSVTEVFELDIRLTGSILLERREYREISAFDYRLGDDHQERGRKTFDVTTIRRVGRANAAIQAPRDESESASSPSSTGSTGSLRAIGASRTGRSGSASGAGGPLSTSRSCRASVAGRPVAARRSGAACSTGSATPCSTGSSLGARTCGVCAAVAGGMNFGRAPVLRHQQQQGGKAFPDLGVGHRSLKRNAHTRRRKHDGALGIGGRRAGGEQGRYADQACKCGFSRHELTSNRWVTA